MLLNTPTSLEKPPFVLYRPPLNPHGIYLQPLTVNQEMIALAQEHFRKVMHSNKFVSPLRKLI
jgi:hypothetical protein